MRIFALICSLSLIALGAVGYYGWGVAGEGPRTLVSAIPAGFGALMLIGIILALLLPKTGGQIALLAAVGGGFSGLGRLTPSYLKGTLDWSASPINLIVAMAAICLTYLVVKIIAAWVPKRSPEKLTDAGPKEKEPESLPC